MRRYPPHRPPEYPVRTRGRLGRQAAPRALSHWSTAVTGKPLAILVNSDDPFNAKTAVGVLRYSPDPIVGLVDPERAGKTGGDVYNVRPDVPIFPRVPGLPANTGRLLVGIASSGGALPPEMRVEVVPAIERGIDVYNGLH